MKLLTANSSASLTVGGTVLAIGVALGAVGLTEVSQATPSPRPFSNDWVIAGTVIALVGAAWVLATFILVVMAAQRTAHFHALLGHALNDGEELSDRRRAVANEATIREWGQQAHDLIAAGLGMPEGRLFLADYDLGVQYSGGQPPGHLWLHRRLQRLTRLMDRMHLLSVGPMTKLPAWRYVSDKDVPPQPFVAPRRSS
jgi:hypothetical protein